MNSDRAYDFIRQKILDGVYPPGSALLTEQLSADVGVSRTPIRDALRQLETDGLVSIRPRLGASVTQMNLKELREMCDLRLALESHAACLAAANRNEADLAEIRLALEGMERSVEAIAAADTEEPLLTDLRRDDVRFHLAIMNAARNDLMKKEILRLHLVNRVVAGTGEPEGPEGPPTKAVKDMRRREVLAAHRAIYDALARRDGVSAKREMEAHLGELIEHSLQSFARSDAGRLARSINDEELLYSAGTTGVF